MNPGAKFCAWTTLLNCISIVFGMRQVFRKQPVNSSSVEGLWVLMECEVEGVTGPVQWVRDGLLLGPGRNLPGFPRYTVTGNSAAGVFNLQIENVQLEDDASYQCQVGQSEESIGIISQTAWLDILIPPQIPVIEELSSQSTLTWVSGKEYLLTCHAKDSKPASSIIFMKSGVELSGAESIVNPGSKVKLFTTVSIIRVTPEDSDNGNELVCGAVNSALSRPRTLSFRMNILFPPEIPTIDGYTRGQVNAGETLSLVCTSIGGNPLAALQWLKNDEVLSQEWETDVSTRTSRSSLSYPVRPEDEGVKLTCQAINEVMANPLRRVIILHVIFAPKRVVILGLARAVEGEQVFLSCITSGSNPPARVRWWAAGKELNVTDVTYRTAALGGVSTVSNVSMLTSRQDNGMSVTCVAVNEAVFLSRSASIIIKVHYPPERIWIQGPPKTTPFPAGSQVTLSCWVSGGNPSARLTWKKGLKTVLGAMYKSTGKLASSEITITTEPSDNLAKYTCSTSSDGKFNPLTAVTQIWVQFAPISMRISASAQTVRQGDLLTLTCHIGSSNPIPEISWIKDGIRLPAAQADIRTVEFGGQALDVDLSLVVRAWDDGRRVVCEAYSPVLSEARNTFHQFNVLHPPQFLPSQVGIVFAEERGAVIFPVQISANPPEVTYSWSRNGQLLVKDGPTRHHLRSDGSLEIWNLSRHDAGLYRLHVGNQEGESQRDLTLDVKYSPRISRLTDPAEVDLGESVELICTADANPVISNMVKWAWTGEGRRVTLDDQVFLNETTKLLIGGATRGDAGRYECSADNGIPPAAMARAELIVRFKPVLQKGVDLSKVAVIGDGSSTATLTCKAEGIPDVQFHWAKNGVSLDPNIPRYSQTVQHEGALHTAQLVIRNVSSALDYGAFTCTAQNPLGLDTFDTQLVKINRPDPPTALTLLSRTHNSVTLSWEPGFNGGLEQTFQIRYTSADSGRDLYTDVYPAQARSFTITGLRSHTVYNFSVSARNALGTSGYTDTGNLLNVSTSDNGGHYPAEGPYTPALRTGGVVLSLPILLPILSLCLLLILLNVGIILALRIRGTGGETNKSASPCVNQLELNDYSDDLVNAMTKQTLLIDTGSEMCSTGFEDYDEVVSASQQEEAPVWGRGLPHTPRSIPRVNPLRDGAHRNQQHITTGYGEPGSGQRFRGPQQGAAGEEEAVYEDVSEETEPGTGQSKYCLNPNQHSVRSHPAVLLTGGFPAGLAALSQSDHRFGMLGELV